MKYLVPIDVRQDKIEIMLASFKVAESAYTQRGDWRAAEEIGKLNVALRKQIFEMEKQ